MIVFATAFLVRVAFWAFSGKLYNFWDFSSSLDLKYYFVYAEALRHFDLSAAFPLHANPLGVILVFISGIFGHAAVVSKIICILADSMNAVLIFRLASVYRGRPAFLPGLLYVVSAPVIIFSNYPMAETLTNTMILLFLSNRSKPVAAGIFAGLSVLGRGNLIIFGILYLGYLLIRRKKALLFALGFAAVLLPFFIKNASLHGMPTPVGSQGAVNLYIGNNENATGGFVDAGGTSDLEGMKGMKGNRYILDSFGFILKHPVRAASLYMKKVFLCFSEYCPPLNLNYYFIKNTMPLLFLLPGFAFFFAFFFANAGAVLKKDAELFWMEIFLIISILPFFLSLRYKLMLLLIPALVLAVPRGRNMLIAGILFLALHFIPKPFSYGYAFRGSSVQLAEIMYNRGAKASAKELLEKAGTFGREPGNISVELFRALMAREEGDTALYVFAMKGLIPEVRQGRFSHRQNFYEEMVNLFRADITAFYDVFNELEPSDRVRIAYIFARMGSASTAFELIRDDESREAGELRDSLEKQ